MAQSTHTQLTAPAVQQDSSELLPQGVFAYPIGPLPKAGAQITPEEFAQALWHPSVRGAVVAVLAGYGLADEADDVLSDTAERGLKNLHKFNPLRGTARAWAKTQARSRAVDHGKRHVRRNELQKRLNHDAANARTSIYTPVSKNDDAQHVVDRLTGQMETRKVLHLTSRFCSNPESWNRVLTLLQECKGDTQKAAWRLGIGEDAVKDSRREVNRISQVVDKALRLKKAGTAVTVGDLFGCLPSRLEIDRHWTKVITKAVLETPGGFKNVTVEDIVARTTFSENTARQYRDETQRLLNIAWTVIEKGEAMLKDIDESTLDLGQDWQ